MKLASADEMAIRADIEARDKHITALRARAALADFELMIISSADGTSAFLISRWGRTVELPDVVAVEAFLDRAAGAMR